MISLLVDWLTSQLINQPTNQLFPIFTIMHSSRNIQKCISILLIVILMQKVEGGLLLHNWLHAQSKDYIESSSPNIHSHSSSCSCIDDFNLPFTSSESTELVKIFPALPDFFSAQDHSIQLPLITFFSLRAPPAIS